MAHVDSHNSHHLAQVRHRYTTVDRSDDWIVTVSWDPAALDRAHWFEAGVEAVNERSGRVYAFPPEISRYRIGEAEHPFRRYVALDWGGDRDAAIDHLLETIFRRVYSFLERGH